MSVHLHDVETLNQYALAAKYDITKISFHTWLKVKEQYQILQVGAALGFGCGPLVVTNKPPASIEINNCRIVLPGVLTTAHLLFQLWAPQAKNKVFTQYNEIFEKVVSGEADCGVIIHEGRFTYEKAGLQLIVDLGARWEQVTGLPIPLGCIVARKDLPDKIIADFEHGLRASINKARDYPEAVLDYMKEHAQEMEEAVIKKHVETYVNEFSLCLGDSGKAAIVKLEEMAKAAGVI